MTSLEWLGSHWHEVALFGITSVVGVIYALEFFGKRLHRSTHKLVAPETTSMLALFFIAVLVVQIELMQHATSRDMQTLTARVLEIQQDRTAGYLMTDDPVLNDIFGPEIEKTRQNAMLLRRHEIELVNIGAYSAYFKRVLQRFPGHTFVAITYPDRDIWRDKDIYDHMQRFIVQEHGTIRRVFILDSLDNISPQHKAIINEHLRAGVTVMLAKRARVDAEKQTPLLVEANGAFGWQAALGPNNTLVAVRASTNPAVTSAWRHAFDAVAADSVPVDQPFP